MSKPGRWCRRRRVKIYGVRWQELIIHPKERPNLFPYLLYVCGGVSRWSSVHRSNNGRRQFLRTIRFYWHISACMIKVGFLQRIWCISKLGRLDFCAEMDRFLYERWVVVESPLDGDWKRFYSNKMILSKTLLYNKQNIILLINFFFLFSKYTYCFWDYFATSKRICVSEISDIWGVTNASEDFLKYVLFFYRTKFTFKIAAQRDKISYSQKTTDLVWKRKKYAYKQKKNKCVSNIYEYVHISKF